ncbi:MAG TPA: cytochrome ubiquinol oxidase subunit I [Syntrophales bacterium]|jgi:cytochrome d ubiquinol oxidase subunit I|nr:cytochrome ubiquinol oxidase subunit I [Syntrophales bacterium]
MDFFSDVLNLSRTQFAVKALFHIIWPVMGIGLSLYIFFMEWFWLKRKDPFYYHQARFWTKLFILNFAMGVVTGIPLSFEFGTNWSRFAAERGGFIGELLGIEATMAFMLESAFLGIMVWGWKRLPPGLHLFSTGMVALGSTLSAFWIMSANSWMQTPAGVVFNGVHYVVTDYFQAIFNPDFGVAFLHMYLACLETTVFVVGGISAWYLLRRQHTDFFLRSFKIAAVAAFALAFLQVVQGDFSGKAVARHQPAKLGAIEAHWDTNPPGEGASWILAAWPNPEKGRNDWAIEVPYVLSLILTYNPTGTVIGLNEFSKDDIPPIAVPFYAFRVMFSIGFALAFLMLWSAWLWYKGRLNQEALVKNRWFLYAWMLAGPAAYTAVEAGWIIREMGRQPWIIHGLMRTRDAVSQLPAGHVGLTFSAYVIGYSILSMIFLYVAALIIARGPDLESPAATGGHAASSRRGVNDE